MRLIDADELKQDFEDVIPNEIVENEDGIKIGLYADNIIKQVIDEQPTRKEIQEEILWIERNV